MRFYLLLLCIIIALNTFAQETALRHYIAENARELNDSSNDFKGLGFLDTLLAGKRIVMLGESSHGAEEYSKTKLQLIKYLHEKLGFNVVLFESPMTPGTYFNLARDTANADELTKNSIQTVWHTKTVSRLFSYMKEDKMSFGGFDPQYIPSVYPNRIYTRTFSNYPDVSLTLQKLEGRIAGAFKTGGINAKLQDSLSKAYSGLAERLGKLSLSPLQQWVKHVTEINADYYRHLNNGNERDSCMAKNVVWLAENMYPNEKIVIWVHNAHIDKNSESPARFMGKLLAAYFGTQLYGLGFYMINGSTALNNRTIIPVKTPVKNSLEDILGKRGFKTAFVSTKDGAFDNPIMTYHWGKDKEKLNLFKSYDAVVLVNGVSSPEYLTE